MSNYNLKAKNRLTENVFEFTAMDNYYGRRKYGYKNLSHGAICTEDEFNELYEVVEQVTIASQWSPDAINNAPMGITTTTEDPNHPYGGMEVEDKETWRDRFDVHVNELRQETHWGKDIDSPTYYFGYKTQRPSEGCDELFTVTDWGNVKNFFQQELDRISKNFMTEFTDPDTQLLNISKYDHERIINFFNREIK
jgi:hypothetical protein